MLDCHILEYRMEKVWNIYKPISENIYSRGQMSYLGDPFVGHWFDNQETCNHLNEARDAP